MTEPTTAEWTLKRLNSEVVGSGPASCEDMTPEQARAAMAQILTDDPAPTTLGAFWLANRWKRNTPEELGAFVDVMVEESVERAQPSCDPVDCGANYDGKEDSAILGVGAAAIAAAAGTPVVIHSGVAVPSQKAHSYKDVLVALGIQSELSPEASAAMADATGVGYYFQPQFNPLVHDRYRERDEMGVRTFINTIETLANPAGAATHIGSFYHPSFGQKMIETIQQAATLDINRVVMVQGMEGYDDLRPGETPIREWQGGPDIDEYAIETSEYGLNCSPDELTVDNVGADSADITESVLTGDRTDHWRDGMVLNAAVRIYAGGGGHDLAEAHEMATNALDSGEAAAVLESLQEFSPDS